MAKRTIRQTAWGNWYGYEGGVRATSFFNSSTETQEEMAKRWVAEQPMRWEATFATSKADAALVFEGERATVAKAVERLGRRRGWTVEVDEFTDQVDAYRVANGRRRRWLVLMP